MLHLRPSLARVRNLVNNALVHRELLFAFRQIAAAAVRVPRLATLIFFLRYLFLRGGHVAAFRKHGLLLLPSAPKREGCSAHKPRRAARPPKKTLEAVQRARTHTCMHTRAETERRFAPFSRRLRR